MTTGTTEKIATTRTEPARPCVWWGAAVVPRRVCETRPEDCAGCPVEGALARVATRKQKDFFPRDYFDQCSVHACAVPDRPCPYAPPCMATWSRTPPAASRILSMMGVGTLSLGVNSSLVQQLSRRVGLHADLVARTGELRAAGKLAPRGKLGPGDLGLRTVEETLSMVAAAAFLDCMDTLDLPALAEALFVGGLGRHGIPGSFSEDRTGEELWDAYRATLGLAILDVVPMLEPQLLGQAQAAIGSIRHESLALALAGLSVQRCLQPITKRPVRLDAGAVERAATLVGFAGHLLGRTYGDLAVTPAELAAAIVIGRSRRIVSDEAAASAGRVLTDNVLAAIRSALPDAARLGPALAGITASACRIEPNERAELAAAVRRSYQERFQRAGDLRTDVVSLLGHLGADNLVREPDRFDEMIGAEKPAAAAVERDGALLGCSMPADLFYFRGHAWIRPEAAGTVRIGIDDLVARLAGAVDSIGMPKTGARVRQGKPVVRLGRAGETVDVLSPIDGEVVAVNRAVVDSPGSMTTDPYGAGWLVMVRPVAAESNLPQLMFSDAAIAWQKGEATRLAGMFQGTAGPTAADGATLAHDPLARIPGVRWSRVLREFLKP